VDQRNAGLQPVFLRAWVATVSAFLTVGLSLRERAWSADADPLRQRMRKEPAGGRRCELFHHDPQEFLLLCAKQEIRRP